MQSSSQLGRSINASFNQCFNWTTGNMFYALSPAYLKRYYSLLIRTCDWWISGWVQGFHSESNLIFPTQFASSLCSKLADLIYGGGFIFRPEKNDGESKAGEFLTGVWEQETNFGEQVHQAIKLSVELGNSLLKLNCSNNELWVDTVAGNRFFVDIDSRGRITASKSFIGFYTAGIASTKQQPDSYALCEERYYKDTLVQQSKIAPPEVKRKPFVKYTMYRVASPTNDVQNVTRGLTYAELPRSIQSQFREEYGSVILNEEKQLPLVDLGVYLIKHTHNVSSMPNIKLGEPAILKVINYLPQYDLITAEKNIVDPRVSRPKVNVPSQMTKRDGDPLSSLDDIVYTKVPNLSDKDQAVTSNFMPSMRTGDLIALRADIIKQICGQIGVETSSVYSDLTSQGAQYVNKTATQISIEQSNTALYIVNKRSVFIGELNRLIRAVLLFYGIMDDVTLEFTEPGTTNKVLMTETISKQKDAGLISQYSALKALNPQTPEEGIRAEIENIAEVKDPTREQQ